MLLPLVNVPMMDYTLEWLAASGVEEVGQHRKLTLTAFDVSTLLLEDVLNLPGVAGVCCVLRTLRAVQGTSGKSQMVSAESNEATYSHLYILPICWRSSAPNGPERLD